MPSCTHVPTHSYRRSIVSETDITSFPEGLLDNLENLNYLYVTVLGAAPQHAMSMPLRMMPGR